MKKLFLSFLSLSVAALAVAQPIDRSVRPKPGPAPLIQLGKSESFTLPNGLKVFVVENHKLPTVTFSIQLDIKPGQEGNMTGYRDMAGELMMSGTANRSKDQLNAEVDAIGAYLNTSASSVYGNSLKKHQGKLLELMSDVLLNPKFTQAELDKARTQTLSGLETQKNEPDAMLNNVSAVVNYGAGHSYGEIPTPATINAITLKACEDYYSTYFRPNVAYMAIVGDVTLAEVKPLVEQYFGKWQRADVPANNYPPVPVPGTTTVSMAPRDAAVQSVFNITYPLDLKPGTPDVIPTRIANTILGGGSTGRLFQNLRETHGWTYGSYSSISADPIVGNFTAYTKCRNAVTDSAIRETLNEMRRMNTELVDPATLANTQMYLTGNFAMSLEDPQRIAQMAIDLERYNMPKDYYTNYLKNLNAVTAQDVLNVSKKYINPDKANIVVVGSKDEVGKQLEQFGPVKFYDWVGNPIQASVMVKAPSNLTGDQVYQKYIDAIGGAQAIGNIKSIKTVHTMTMQGMQITRTEIKSGGKYKEEIGAQGMVFQKKLLNGKTAYEEQQGQRANLTGDDLSDLQEEADIQAVLHPEQYGNKRTLRGQDMMNGVSVYVVDVVDAAGKKTTEYYETGSGLLIKQVSTEKTDQGDVNVVLEYSDYLELPGGGGYKAPSLIKLQQGPMTFDMTLKTAEINKTIPDSEFQ